MLVWRSLPTSRAFSPSPAIVAESGTGGTVVWGRARRARPWLGALLLCLALASARAAAGPFPPRPPALDRDRDGSIDPDERVELHRAVPQFVLFTVRVTGSETGLRFLREQLTLAGAWGHVSYFIDEEARARRGLPQIVEQAVLAALTEAAAAGNALYPASAWPARARIPISGTPGWPDIGLDLSWPAPGPSSPGPSSLGPGPGLGPARRRGKGAPAPVPVPLVDWLLFQDGAPRSCPSLLGPLVRIRPMREELEEEADACSLGSARMAAVQVVANLRAHLAGNRVPFHIGLDDAAFAPGQDEARSTLKDVLAELALLRRSGQNLFFASTSELLAWLAGGGGDPPSSASRQTYKMR
jgi:hypothetical protein